ncbi:MAG: hypothetical protein H0T77_09065 [Pyrinomonadaceae bacterium]|nr:hypothetical protein [Pyrinomonadaceae bacterium]
MVSYGFHSEAADEYLAATRYYLDHASPLVATAFVAEIEGAIQTLLTSPTTWPIVDEPQIRRYLLKQFPYSVYIAGNQRKKEFPYTPLCISANDRRTGVIAPDQ